MFSLLKRPSPVLLRFSLTSSKLAYNSTMSNNSIFKNTSLFNVEDYVAVVTGGATGIGLMAAQALANNGARVYIIGRRTSALDNAASTHGTPSSLQHPKGKIIPLQGDITSKESITHIVNELSQREKKIDVLVNNAGISVGSSTVEKGDENAQNLREELWSEKLSDWEDVYRTNVIGHFFTSVALLPLLSAASSSPSNPPSSSEGGEGTRLPGHSHTASIINITSISGITRTTQHHYKYNVSKAAAIQLNTLLAQEFRREGVKIRVNAIAPGIFPSEMTTSGSSSADNKSQIAENESEEKSWAAEKGIPAGRPGKDEDIAQAVLFLATCEYIYGQNIAVDGGYLLDMP